jgi:hypothetical protein
MQKPNSQRRTSKRGRSEPVGDAGVVEVTMGLPWTKTTLGKCRFLAVAAYDDGGHRAAGPVRWHVGRLQRHTPGHGGCVQWYVPCSSSGVLYEPDPERTWGKYAWNAAHKTPLLPLWHAVEYPNGLVNIGMTVDAAAAAHMHGWVPAKATPKVREVDQVSTVFSGRYDAVAARPPSAHKAAMNASVAAAVAEAFGGRPASVAVVLDTAALGSASAVGATFTCVPNFDVVEVEAIHAALPGWHAAHVGRTVEARHMTLRAALCSHTAVRRHGPVAVLVADYMARWDTFAARDLALAATTPGLLADTAVVAVTVSVRGLPGPREASFGRVLGHFRAVFATWDVRVTQELAYKHMVCIVAVVSRRGEE